MAATSENEATLMQKLADAFEDAGLYSPSRELVEGVYVDVIEPLAGQLRLEGLGAVGAGRWRGER